MILIHYGVCLWAHVRSVASLFCTALIIIFFNLFWPSWWEIGLTLLTGGSYKVYQGLSVGPPPACRKSTAHYHHGSYSGRSGRGCLVSCTILLALLRPILGSMSHVSLKLLPWAALNDECRTKMNTECHQPCQMGTSRAEKFECFFAWHPSLKKFSQLSSSPQPWKGWSSAKLLPHKSGLLPVISGALLFHPMLCLHYWWSIGLAGLLPAHAV